ncbi:MAG: DUF4386 family protein [Dehalococcoidia bacterium]
MSNDRSFKRLAGWAAIVSAPLAFASVVLSLAPVNFDFEAFTDASLAIQKSAGQGDLIRWSWVLDVLGYYLLLLPLALFMWNWLKPRNPNLVTLFTLCGLGYLFFGALGAAIFAAVLSTVADAYAQATGVAKQTQEALYVTFSDAVMGGVWSTLNALLSAAWWLGIGAFLQSERRVLGWVTIVLGAIIAVSWVGTITDLQGLIAITVPLYLLIAPLWALWLGIVLLRMPVPTEG